MKRFLKLIRLTFPYYRYMIISVFCLIFYTFLNGFSILAVVPLVDRILAEKIIELPSVMKFITIPYFGELQSIVDTINSCDKSRMLFFVGLFVFIAFFLKGIFLYVQQVSMEIVGQMVGRDVRTKLYNKYYDLPMTYFSKSRIGELMSRITNDVNLIHEVFSGRFMINIKDAVQVVPFLIIIFIIDWKLSFLCLTVLPFLLVPVSIIGRKIRNISRKTLEKVADISSVINETISGIKIVKIFCMEKYEQSRFYKQLDKFKNLRVDMMKKQSIFNPLTEIIGGVVVMFLLIVFPPKVMRGEITPGFFMLYLICMASLVKPLRTIGKLNFAVQNAMASLDRIFELLNAEEGIKEVKGSKEFSDIKSNITFSNVSFAYEKDQDVLEDININLGINKITAIVGPSGCGKTSLVSLIPRFFDPQKGDISIDGTDLRSYNIKSLREKIGMVTQETFLFNDTIARNIAYGNEGIDIERIKNIAHVAHAAGFIESFPDKYNTVIGEKGARLSGGQKQRLAIARALLKNPPILILDEATSALDTESERIVQDAINTLMKGRTVIVIAHRLSTIMKADVIYVMDQGKIVQYGRHDELLIKSSLYKKLYDMQFV
ncbi:MAG: ABC transporter ATP-binding protein [Candidatus Aureabacteria bacterium]|nr:ABC transporter ATP-binding protein [Candidatus Auribacterota bacterium]